MLTEDIEILILKGHSEMWLEEFLAYATRSIFWSPQTQD